MKYSTHQFLQLISFFLLLTSTTFAQNSTNKYDLLLKIGNVNLAENAKQYIQNYNSIEQQAADGKIYKIVQFYEIPRENTKNNLRSLGIKLIDYLPNFAYIISLPADFDFSLFLNYNIRNISDIIPEYKQDPYILDKNYPEWAMHENNQLDIMITYFNDISYIYASSELSNLVSETIQEDLISNVQIARVNIADLETIISLPYVQYVEPLYPAGEPENYTGKTLHRSNVLDSQFETGRHYDGTNVKVMLQDDGIIGPHIDYEGRIGAQNLTYNYGDHGDHCAGTIFGSGNLDPKTKGMAPGAELHTWGAAPEYPGFNAITSAYNNTGIRISSTSYSNGCNAGYTSLARTMDLQIRNFESLMHVFSAGNAGTDNCGYGAGAGWGNVTGGHKVGKNVITVANLTSTDGLSGSSSRGPAHDGRIKPDISAKGSSVYSTIDPNDYALKSGTSMSCPGVAGSLAQLYQAYKELNNGEEPAGGLMKSLILNTADDLGNVGPDFKHGWGRINLLRAVELLEEDRFLTDEIDESETNTHTFDVPDGTKQIKVMVYWTDKESNVGSNKALVNDLDIFVEDPSSEAYLPWKLSHFPHADSLDKPATKALDHHNNMEQVSIDNPAAGTYTLNVDGYLVPFGPQEYYVIYEFIMDEITLTYPIGGESFAPQEYVMVRWDAFGNTGPFMAEYSLNDGTDWNIANSNISENIRYYNWVAPSEITSKALIRVSRDGMTSTSTESFNIMRIPSDIEFVSSCPESTVVKWEPVTDAVSYDVFMLGDKYMEIVGNSTSDSLLVEGVNYDEEYWFSIRAIGTDNAIGRRSEAKMKSTGIWNCQFERDLGIADIISPPLGVLFDCQDYSNLNIMIELKNFGLETVDNIETFYQFDGGTIISEPYIGSIDPGESFIHEFSSTVSLPAAGYYNMKAWIEIDNDENSANNIVEGNCKLKTTQQMAINEIITFDEFSSCGFAPDCEEVNCYINNKWFNLENDLNDNIDWRVLGGITPTPNTGPIGDHTLGTAAGKFLYLEASGDCYNKKAILMSPCADLSTLSNPGMLFWFNLNGADMGSLHIDIISNGILHKDIIAPMSGDWDAEWHEGMVNLQDFAGQEINLRFRAYTGDGELSDLAIDDILVTEMTRITTTNQSIPITIYPNPSLGIYNLEFSMMNMPEVRIKIVDITGREIYSDNIKCNSTSNTKYTLNLNDLNEGIYYLLFEGKDGIYKEKLIKI